MPKVQVNGVELSYRQIGTGPEDLILLHGLAANQAFWNLQLLKPLARHYRVTTYDLRGHGYSSMPETGYTGGDMAKDLTGLLDHLEIDRPHLAGHSFGGTVATHFASSWPGRIKSLTLIDTRLKALQPRERLIDWPHWREAKKQFEDLNIEVDEHEEGIGLQLLERVAAPEWKATRERLAKSAKFIPFGGWSAGDRVAARWIRLLRETPARADFRGPDHLPPERLLRVRSPMCGIYGGNSRCLITGRRLGEIWPDIKVHVLPDVGHFFPAIRPDIVSGIILEFLTGLRATRSLSQHPRSSAS